MGFKMPIKRKKSNTNLTLKLQREERKKKGLCIYCETPARENRTTCETHGKRHSKISVNHKKKKRRAAAEFKFCRKCFSPNLVPGKKNCASCIEQSKLDARVIRANRKLEHKCIYCGKKLDTDYKLSGCKECLDHRRPNVLLRFRARAAKWKKEHKCSRCGKQLKSFVKFVTCLTCRLQIAKNRASKKENKNV